MSECSENVQEDARSRTQNSGVSGGGFAEPDPSAFSTKNKSREAIPSASDQNRQAVEQVNKRKSAAQETMHSKQ
jgi:hypothetical protein